MLIFAEDAQLSRRTSVAALAAAVLAACQKRAEAEEQSAAGLGNVENATEGVQREEKVAISSTSSTDTLPLRGAENSSSSRGEVRSTSGQGKTMKLIVIHRLLTFFSNFPCPLFKAVSISLSRATILLESPSKHFAISLGGLLAAITSQ